MLWLCVAQCHPWEKYATNLLTSIIPQKIYCVRGVATLCNHLCSTQSHVNSNYFFALFCFYMLLCYLPYYGEYRFSKHLDNGLRSDAYYPQIVKNDPNFENSNGLRLAYAIVGRQLNFTPGSAPGHPKFSTASVPKMCESVTQWFIFSLLRHMTHTTTGMMLCLLRTD